MKLKKMIYSIIMLLTVTFTLVLFPNTSISNAVNESYEIVMDINSGRILHGRNINSKRYMASTTKIVTAITVIENCNIDDVVTISSKTVGIEGSSIYLKEGEKLSVTDLLYGLMLRSGNDCAETLAIHCSGSIAEFAKLMNKTALKCGATNTNFVNPHGLHDDNHYTTCYDLAKISAHAMKNETFRKIVSTKSIRIYDKESGECRLLINKNKLLNNLEGCNGIKTGYTKKAGRCLVSSCTRNGLDLVCVVLDCPPMFERSKELFENTFKNFKEYKIVDKEQIIGFTYSKQSGKNYPVIIENSIILPLTEQEKNSLNIVYEYDNEVLDDNTLTDNNWQIKIYAQNNLIFTQKLYTII